MDQMEIRQLVARQRAYFQSGATLPARARVEALRALRSAVAAREEELNDALRADLGKSAFESYMCEVGMVLSELTYMIRRTPAFAADRRVRTPLAQFAARSYVKPSPYGTVLIMSPWNYPLLLTLAPLIDALAAGNTAVVKPSAYSPATSRVIARLPGGVLSPGACLGGHRRQAGERLPAGAQKFDYIFFTGSQAVGREVLLHAAQYLTPVTLELGGKSPCIVDETADLKLTARRIVFGKYLNCGQTCVAPDYLLWPGERQGRPAGGDRPADHCSVRPRPPGQPQLREDRQPEALPATAGADPARRRWCAAAPGRRRPCASLPR